MHLFVICSQIRAAPSLTVTLSSWECNSLEAPSWRAESLTPRGAGQLPVPVAASWWVSS